MHTAIDNDTDALVEIIELISERRALTAWPDRARAVLSLAMADERANAAEAGKAERLRRHLFGDLPPPRLGGSDVQSRWAERVRADLPGIVPFGSCFHLSDPTALAQEWLAMAR